ncbi:hypothetical protein HYFRA_00010653 [Hymenoscyphus fraxineus]|uniref:Uncharacterized protein n=1 Tax=Hymenoscyphus fraxineus TaxID=746836 RepID=A0A9N9L6U0_9HELO|nr:hypothetical protein HYFRA_00010653 [Hymenoscyphus fraxineus]
MASRTRTRTYSCSSTSTSTGTCTCTLLSSRLPIQSTLSSAWPDAVGKTHSQVASWSIPSSATMAEVAGGSPAVRSCAWDGAQRWWWLLAGLILTKFQVLDAASGQSSGLVVSLGLSGSGSGSMQQQQQQESGVGSIAIGRGNKDGYPAGR